MAISITDKAAGRVVALLEEQGKKGAMLRIWVAGLGCSGFRYGMGLDEEKPEEGDSLFESNGIRIVIDPQSLSYMEGSSVDWIDDPENGGFDIKNPNPAPAGGCSCGSEGCGSGEAGGCGENADGQASKGGCCGG